MRLELKEILKEYKQSLYYIDLQAKNELEKGAISLDFENEYSEQIDYNLHIALIEALKVFNEPLALELLSLAKNARKNIFTLTNKGA